MNTKKFLLGTLIGGVVFFLLGWLFYGVLFMDFMVQHSAPGMGKEPDFPFLILANLAAAALLSFIFLKWASISTFSSGATAGLIIGFLTALNWDLAIYATTNMGDLTLVLMDILIVSVMSAISGGVIGMVIGMGKE